MSDMIKRSDAIEAIEIVDWYHINRNGDLVSGARSDGTALYKAADVYKALEEVPSADRPKGKWIEDYNGNGWNDYWDYTCSNCGKRYERADEVLCKANFCPNCGARMKGTNDE